MTLQERLLQDMKAAMKAKEKITLAAIRFARSAMKNREIELGKQLEEEDELKVIVSLVKQHKDSIEQYQQGGRDDLVEREQAELAVLEAYLPQQLSEEDIRALVTEAIEAIEATSMKDMGKVMRYIMPKVQGRADGKQINQLVKEQLG
jgi:uncharacterized protein YqeY